MIPESQTAPKEPGDFRQGRIPRVVRFRGLAAAVFLLQSLASPAADGTTSTAATSSVDFSRDIRPILEKRCVECHGSGKRKGGLRLDRKADALRGGSDHAPDIVPGNSAASPLLRFVAGLDPDIVMPPEGERLSGAEIARLRAWIDAGAPWPDDTLPAADDPARHWSFQPIRRPAVPAVTNAAWARTSIDAFVLARLEREGLSPSPPADPRTLLRRLSFDLVGLPPTAAEVDAFVGEKAATYSRRVEELLVSPRHGERWAQHWLDVVRFSETHGFEMNNPRPNAWPYRDYVIRAFNEDLPYDQFIRDQIAGDLVGADEATGFLVAGSWDQVKSPDVVLTSNQRADELHDIVSTTSSAFLGLTLGCARCHDHKFDPIPQRDYYGIKAVFEGVQHGERVLRATADEDRRAQADTARKALAAADAALSRALSGVARAGGSAGDEAPPSVGPRGNADWFEPVLARRLRFTITATSGAEPCLDELEIYTAGANPTNVALASTGARLAASGTYPNSDLHRLEHLNDGRYGNSRSWISNESGRGWVEVTFAQPALIDTVVWARDREGKFGDRLATGYRIEVEPADAEGWRTVSSSAARTSLPPVEKSAAISAQLTGRDTLAARLASLAGEPMAYLGQFKKPEATKRFHRGDPMQPREDVAPGALTQVGSRLILDDDASEPARRLALAKWIADAGNPLTARVIANRIWQHHFGEGLVSTPSDFGINGARPTHPELLDWLASELVTHGWSLRHLHRLILNSSTYRQSGDARPEGLRMDAGTRWFWRFPPCRLEAEAIRDTILAVSGNLDLRMGGPGWSPFEPNENYVRVYTPRKEFGPDAWRRMVYATHVRQRPDGVFGAFDCPDGGQIAPRRTRSTTPLQALNLLNSGFLLQQAEMLSGRLERESGKAEAAKQVRRAFGLLFQREPDAEEFRASVEFVRAQGLMAFCRALLNANEFVYVF